MQIIAHQVPAGWLRAENAAKAARMSFSRAKQLIVTGAIPVEIDRMGYMWLSKNSLRNGAVNAEHL